MNSYLKNNMSLTQKICLAGLFIALITILQKVVAINYIAVVPFLRVSFGGCALLMVSSIVLGPWWGLLIGAASDILGYFVFDPKTMGFFPQITAIYAVFGFVAYFIYLFVSKINNKKAMMIVECSFFAICVAAITLFFTLNNQITLYSSTYQIELWQKILIPILSLVFFGIVILVTVLIDKHLSKKNDPRIKFNAYQVSFASLIIEVLVMIIFGTLMKGLAFGFQTYLAILICQVLVALINIPLNTVLVSYIMLVFRRVY